MLSFEYLAGLVDGEGNIRLCPSNKGKYRKYYPRIQVTNSNTEILNLLLSQLGGSISKPKKSLLTRKEVFDWRLSGDKARQLLTKLIPFLIIKKEQAIYVLQKDNKALNN